MGGEQIDQNGTEVRKTENLAFGYLPHGSVYSASVLE